MAGQKHLQRGQRQHAVGRDRLRLQRAQPLDGFHRVARRQRARAFGKRQHGDRPPRARRRLQPQGGAGKAQRPVRGRSPAVVEQQHQRAAPAAACGKRVQHRPGHRENHQGRQQQAQQQNPPRRARGRLLLARRVEDQLQRRKRHFPRPRRRDAEQEIDQRQQRQRGEDQRRGEGERQAEHQRASPASSRIRNASSASEAGRSVRWTAKLQPRDRALARMRSRC